jgi:triphosphatase
MKSANRTTVPIETEIKLEFLRNEDARAIRAGIRRAVGATPMRAVTHSLRSIYFDTPDQDLAERRISLRLRKVKSRWEQTVKIPRGIQSGLQTYYEYDAGLPAGEIDLSLIPGRAKSMSWLARQRQNLRPTFETDIRRTTWLVEAGSSKIELAWDRGDIRAGKKSRPVNELELELKAGNHAELFSLARNLVAHLPVRLGDATKAERGHALTRSGAVVGPRLGYPVAPKDNVATAFHGIASECVVQMRINEHAILADSNPESIHQFRVGLRRLRAVLGIYRQLIDDEVFAQWTRELRWAHQAFGRARDLDVFVSDTLLAIANLYPADATLQNFLVLAERAKLVARENAQATLISCRYNQLLLALTQSLQDGCWKRNSAAASLAMPIKNFAIEHLQRRYKRVRKLGDRWPDLQIADLHRLRILVKKLRYVAVAFTDLFPPRATRDFLARLEGLQDCLGALNDGLVGQQYVAEITAMATGEGRIADEETHRAAGMILGWQARGIEVSRRGFDAGWRSFAAQKRFWRT